MYRFLEGKYIFTIFAYEFFKVKMKKNVKTTRNTFIWVENTSKYCSQIIVDHVHANSFL